ncbi:hypothetical protein BC830DRAFT_1169858 [Chytriomyces sp. MP71]|nr:hypothetical protein BC830DRAFT_1169858 [Chytriomyces sp. MP71]
MAAVLASVAHAPWVALRAAPRRRTLLVKSVWPSPPRADLAYSLVAHCAGDPSVVYSESLSLADVSRRIAVCSPAYTRNAPQALLVHIRRLLIAQASGFTYTVTSVTSNHLHLSIAGRINGLLFTWTLELASLSLTDSSLNPVSDFVAPQLIAPLEASMAVLLEQHARMTKVIADREREVEELRAVLSGVSGTVTRVKKTPAFSATQCLQDSLNTALDGIDTDGASSDCTSKKLFTRLDVHSLYTDVMGKLMPHTAAAFGNAGQEDDVELHYDGEGASQYSSVASRQTGIGASQSAGVVVSSPQSPQKTKKEEAEESAEKRLKELLELGEKKQASAAAKPKKRKLI